MQNNMYYSQIRSNNNNNNVVLYEKHDMSTWSELYSKDRNIRVLCQLAVLSSIISLGSSIAFDSINAKRLTLKTLYFIKPITLDILVSSILVEISLVSAAFLLHPLFKLWARLRSSCSTTVVDVVFTTLYSVAIVGSFVYMLWICSKLNAPHYVNFTLATEQIRLCMKTYSFVRENAYKVLYPWHKDDSDGPAVWYAGQMSPSIGSFRQYLYFLIAPTLLYRDHYPRTQQGFNYKSFATHVFLVLLTLVFSHHLFGLIQVESFYWYDVLVSLIKGIPLGVVFGVVMNINFTHSWMNAWAELTGFSDRRFYEDWWLSCTFPDFFRKWNIVPYHFNHQYIYKDIRKLLNSKYLALFLMFFASSAYHEYIQGVGFGYAVPLVTLFFAGIGPVAIVLRVKGTFTTVCCICFGLYLLLWNISIENKARSVCPREETFIDVFYPRLFECIMKHSG